MGVSCVVLAAGRGSRLGRSRCKPLEVIQGLTLIERVIATVAQAGVDDFVVVTGYQAAGVEAFVGQVALRRGLRITSVENHAWPDGNGTSALSAASLVDNEFVLVMGDHVFEEGIIRRLLSQPVEPGGAVVAADFRVGAERVADDADATKLIVDVGRVTAIGKELERYNAYDTGAFLCTPALFDALAGSVASGDGSLSGGVRRLAEAGQVRAFDVGAAYWVDVDTAADARRAKAVLRATLGKPEDGLVSRMLNRHVSGRVLTPLLLRVWPGVTPNAVSLLGFLVALVAAGCFVSGWPAAAGVLVALASILDGSDGEVARLKHGRSGFGAYFDAVLDRYADTAMLAGATVYAWDAGGGGAAVAAGAAAAAGNLMVSYTSARSVIDLAYRYEGAWLAAGRGRDLRLLVLSLSGVVAAAWPAAVIAALTVLALLTNAIVAARLVLSWRINQPTSLVDTEAVIFDLDGTVADTMPFLTNLAVELLKDYGLPDADEARRRYLRTVGVDFASQLEELFPGHSANRTTVAAFEARKEAELARCPPVADVAGTLAFLRDAGVRRYLCSSTRADLVATYLATHALTVHFEDHAGFEPGLPKDRQVEMLVRRHGHDPQRVLFVGDALRDAELTRPVGVRFVGVHGTFPPGEFRRRGLPSVRDLATLSRTWQQHARRHHRVAHVEHRTPIASR